MAGSVLILNIFAFFFAIFAIFCLKRLNLQNITNRAHGATYFESEMDNFLIVIFIGLVAVLIDIIPMIIQKLDKQDMISAFVHYFALGLIIPFVNWGITPWLTGIVIALLTSIPIIVFSLILGARIGIAGAKFIG